LRIIYTPHPILIRYMQQKNSQGVHLFLVIRMSSKKLAAQTIQDTRLRTQWLIREVFQNS
jgi:hypothetical protein